MREAVPKQIIDVPLILNGERIVPEDRPIVHHLNYDNGIRVRMPALQPQDLAAVKERSSVAVRQLTQLTTDDLTLFLNAVGDRWLSGVSPARRFANRYAHEITGFPTGMMSADYETIGHFLVHRSHTWDTVLAEFGYERIFDEWIPRQMCYIRAFPRGLLVHCLVGNLPLAGLYSVIRGVITRNCNLLKVPSRDPVSVSSFVQAMLEIDPDHPVSRSVSVAYWSHEDPVGSDALNAADAVCVWGGGEAVEAVKKAVRADVPISVYGPRWSGSVIDLTQCDPDEAALRLVEDVSFYDQEACFNSQRAFVCGDLETFRKHLRRYFDLFSNRYPLLSNRDSLAHRAATLLEARFLDFEVDEGNDWAVVVEDQRDEAVVTHPLTRTLFIRPIQCLSEVAAHLNSDTQTVGVMPWRISEQYRDQWALAGANRIVELGWSRLPRQGFTHDGVYGLHSLIRLVSVERSRSEFGQYYISPADSKTWQRAYFLGERWWSDPWWYLADRNVVESSPESSHSGGSNA
jgi:long-chain-fatty-acyl-CoA reductase